MAEPTVPATLEQTCEIEAHHQVFQIFVGDTASECFRWANGLSPYDTLPTPPPPSDCYGPAHGASLPPSAPYTAWCPNFTDEPGTGFAFVIWYDDTNVIDPGPPFSLTCAPGTITFQCLPSGLAQTKTGFWTCPCAHCPPGDPYYDDAGHD